jgi:hypothetical protein
MKTRSPCLHRLKALFRAKELSHPTVRLRISRGSLQRGRPSLAKLLK